MHAFMHGLSLCMERCMQSTCGLVHAFVHAEQRVCLRAYLSRSTVCVSGCICVHEPCLVHPQVESWVKRKQLRCLNAERWQAGRWQGGQACFVPNGVSCVACSTYCIDM